MTTSKEGFSSGKPVGKAEGISIGEARGESQGIGIALRALLEMTFGSLPPSLIEYIENSSDVDTLRKLTLAAARAESPNAFMHQRENDGGKLLM